MKFNIPNLKKKIVKKYEETVKKATTTAIPIIKKEATKAISKETDQKIDLVFDILVVAGIGAAVLLSKGGSAETVRQVSEAATYVHIENLTINL